MRQAQITQCVRRICPPLWRTVISDRSFEQTHLRPNRAIECVAKVDGQVWRKLGLGQESSKRSLRCIRRSSTQSEEFLICPAGCAVAAAKRWPAIEAPRQRLRRVAGLRCSKVLQAAAATCMPTSSIAGSEPRLWRLQAAPRRHQSLLPPRPADSAAAAGFASGRATSARLWQPRTA